MVNNFPVGRPQNVPTQITFRAGGQAALRNQIRKMKQDLADLSRRSRSVNEQATVWMARESTQELRTRIQGGNRRQHSDKVLERITADHTQNSSWTENGFVFYDRKLMDKSEVRDYYRVIERGDKQHYLQYNVPLVFLGKNGGRYKYQGERHEDLGVYEPDSNFPAVPVIVHDFGGYHYVKTTRERFMQNKIYDGLIAAEVAKLQTLGPVFRPAGRTRRLGGMTFFVPD